MSKTLNSIFLALAMLGGSAVAANAAVSAWAYSEGGKMRLSALADGPDKLTAILEIDPAPGWKTYWRAPGDAGLPPEINLSTGGNLKLVKVSYPAPEISRDEGGRFFGYHRPVTLVLELEKPHPDRPSLLNADVLIGLCKDICMPFQSTFSLPLDNIDQPQADEFMKIQMAKAELPEQPSPAFEITGSGLTADKAYFEATVVSPGDAAPEIALAPSRDVLLGGKPEIVRRDGLTHIRYQVKRLPASLEGASVTLLVKAAGRAIETTLAID